MMWHGCALACAAQVSSTSSNQSKIYLTSVHQDMFAIWSGIVSKRKRSFGAICRTTAYFYVVTYMLQTVVLQTEKARNA